MTRSSDPIQVNWPFSIKVYRDMQGRNANAKSRYEALRNKYLKINSTDHDEVMTQI